PVEVAGHHERQLRGTGPAAGLRGAGVGTLPARPGSALEEPVERRPAAGVGLLLVAGGRLAGEQPPVVGAARRLRTRAVGVQQRVLLRHRVQVRYRADVVRTLHGAVAAGPDRGGAVAEVVVE